MDTLKFILILVSSPSTAPTLDSLLALSTCVCVADDGYLLSNSPSGLQGAINIICHYAKRYQLQFNASKTKIVVTGSKIDMTYYQETAPWTLNGERIEVVDMNEHLGLIVAGLDEEQKNIDAITICNI